MANYRKYLLAHEYVWVYPNGGMHFHVSEKCVMVTTEWGPYKRLTSTDVDKMKTKCQYRKYRPCPVCVPEAYGVNRSIKEGS
jgi:hypothetical protein